MNISYNWLKEYVEFNLAPQEVAQALTSIGLEVGGVEEVQKVKGGLEGIVVGEVLTCEPHPNSDHMHVTTVSLGNGQAPVQIVCGAPNVAAGQKVMVATLGTKLYSGDECFTIKKSKLRGVESVGMICAEDEIGMGSDHSGIIVLPEEAVPGTKAADYYQLKSDWLIEVDITPNRSDACSHYGVARDLYACLVQRGEDTKLTKPAPDAFKAPDGVAGVTVTVEAPEACPRYAGVTITNVTVADSPEWLQDKLRVIGLKPINNVVDITNYILFAFGHPMHCFDADQIEGGGIVVKTMPQGTPFVTLDGVERRLDGNDLMICDTRKPLCMGGVFGGLHSGVTRETRNVFLECACFNPTQIRKTARRHGLSTDSSFRFERGVDPLDTIYCLKMAALLVAELGGGTIASEIHDVRNADFKPARVQLDYAQVDALIGKHICPETVKSIARSLEMDIVEQTEQGVTLDIPPYRVDVKRPCDVIEDILRIYGYNNVEIPTTLKSSLTGESEADKSNKLQNLVAEQLVGAGFCEIMNNSLTKAAWYEELETYPTGRLVKVLNPLSNDLGVMRQTLLFGGLETIARNSNHRNPDLKLFEYGNCYACDNAKRNPDKPLAPYSESFHLGLWITGKHVQNSWAHPNEDTSFYMLKAAVENILARLGLGGLQVASVETDIMAAAVAVKSQSGKQLAVLGTVSRKLLKRMDIDAPVYYADLCWDEVMRATQNVRVSYKELPKFPAVKRDLALLVDNAVKFADIERTVRTSDRKLVKSVTLFDVYEGKNLPEGKKSYAVSVTLQDENQTLNDKTIDKAMQKIAAALQHTVGATLRQQG